MSDAYTTNAKQTTGDARRAEPGHEEETRMPRIFAHEDPAVEQLIRDELHEHSPEGDGPATPSFMISTGVLIILAILAFITIVGIVAVLGGWQAALLAAGFVFIAYLLAGFPVLQAARLRAREETTVRRIVKGEPLEPTPKV